MKLMFGDFVSKAENKNAAARLKILSRKAGGYDAGSPKNIDIVNSSIKNVKNFRISPTKHNDSKIRLDSRKVSQPSEILENNHSNSNLNLHLKDPQYYRRPSGVQNYMGTGSPRK